MRVITVSEAQAAIEHVAIRLNEPIGLLGQFGGGKTAAVEQAAAKLDAHLCKFLLGQYDTVDLKGTPWVAEKSGYKSTVWRPASTLPFVGNPDFPEDKDIILFLDEATSATIPVMGVCYQLTNERRVGEHVLMPRVRIVLAGNRESDKGIVTRIPMPLCNRITWYEVGIDLTEWCNWALQHDVPPVIVSFLQFRKGLLCNYEPAKAEKVVATPRTWEKASKYYADEHMPRLLKEASISGAIGEGVATEFWAFVNVWQEILALMPSIFKDPTKAKLPEKLDLRYAVSVALSGELDDADKRPAASTYLLRLDPEFCVLAWQLAVARNQKLFHVPEFLTYAKKYRQLAN
jgi:hypothetical protein